MNDRDEAIHWLLGFLAAGLVAAVIGLPRPARPARRGRRGRLLYTVRRLRTLRERAVRRAEASRDAVLARAAAP